jgi:hypothetical protein
VHPACVVIADVLCDRTDSGFTGNIEAQVEAERKNRDDDDGTSDVLVPVG